MAGWVIASSRRRASGSAKTRAASRLRSSAPAGVEDARAERARRPPASAGRAGRDHLARERVGVDDRDAAGAERGGEGALPGRDPAREADDAHG